MPKNFPKDASETRKPRFCQQESQKSICLENPSQNYFSQAEIRHESKAVTLDRKNVLERRTEVKKLKRGIFHMYSETHQLHRVQKVQRSHYQYSRNVFHLEKTQNPKIAQNMSRKLFSESFKNCFS